MSLTYRVFGNPGYYYGQPVSDVELETMCKWAVERKAEAAFINFLGQTLFRLRDERWSMFFTFCSTERRVISGKDYEYHYELVRGGALVIWTAIWKNSKMREDQIESYSWDDEMKGWRGRTDHVFYAKNSPFGGYTKKMPLEWGLEKKRQWVPAALSGL